MQTSVNQKTETIKHDILYHLNTISTSTRRLQLDYNRDMALWHFAENTIRGIEISKNLLITDISPFVLDLKTQVNELFQNDKTLSTVVVKIVNPNRSFNNNAIAYLNFPL